MTGAEDANAFIAVVVAALTQLGIPAVFVYAWYNEWKAHRETTRQHTRDLRRCAGLTTPEDVMASGD